MNTRLRISLRSGAAVMILVAGMAQHVGRTQADPPPWQHVDSREAIQSAETASQTASDTKQDRGQVDDLIRKFTAEAHQQWETEIRQLEARDRSERHPEQSILFLGSSSIRLWETMAQDVAPFHPIQRGYGGARFSDLAVFASRLITPHSYQALVVFAANDVTGSEDDHSCEQIKTLVRRVIEVSQAHCPSAPILLVEVTPTKSRFQVWAQIRQVNAVLREFALTWPNVYFVATAEHYLDRNKQPRTELFTDDQLHQNRQGYQLWGSLIRNRLHQVLCAESVGSTPPGFTSGACGTMPTHANIGLGIGSQRRSVRRGSSSAEIPRCSASFGVDPRGDPWHR